MVQPSIIALGASLLGIVLQNYAAEYRFIYIIGTACIMGAFVIAFTEFVLFLKDSFMKSRKKAVPKTT